MTEPVLARKMHRTMEIYHGFIYFSPHANAAYADLGLGERAGYFASRAAALGPVPAEVVVATFFNFHPDLVARHIPHAWSVASPSDVSAARLRAADATLRQVLGDEVDGRDMARAAELARTAASDLPLSGRPLFAGHAALDWPEEPHLVLWHAQTLIREFRGDGHIACLVESGVARGIEALVMHAASGDVPAETLRTSREWSEGEWASAVSDLADRGWLAGDGSFTDAGREVWDGVEARTDQLAMTPWSRLGDDACDELRSLVRPFSRALVSSGVLTFPAR
ncbi:MAG: SCO6745 family protein [Acidimicrobiales bacterium]